MLNIFKDNKLFFILMLIGALAWSIHLTSIVINGLKTSDWPSVNGSIVSSSEKRINHNKERYNVEVNYKYTVDGEIYQGHKVANFKAMLTRFEKDKMLKRYKSDEKIPVYYDPNNHSTAYLERGLDKGVFILFAVCLGLMFFAIFNLVRPIRSGRN